MSVLLQFILIVLFMVGAAFFAGMETGMISINRIRLRHFVRKKRPGASILMKFLDKPDRLLGTTLVWTNLCVVASSILAAGMMTRLIGPWGKLVSGVIMTILLIIVAEFLPKAWFQSRPLARTLPYANLLRLSEIVIRPFALLILRFGDLIIFAPETDRIDTITREEIGTLVDDEVRHGVISLEEYQMIRKAMSVSKLRVSEIMSQKDEIVSINGSMTVSEVYATARNSEYTKLPFFDKDKKKLLGMVDVDRLLAIDPVGDVRQLIYGIMMPVEVIPETAFVSEVLAMARTNRSKMFMVGSRDGSDLIGLVTVGDVFKEILGEV
ncbi:MAG: DUF21 domain-containing protein [Lentisphaerae bacterium]|nr:DUF21 domain-containing protein [Lentisphaerota bacterium]